MVHEKLGFDTSRLIPVGGGDDYRILDLKNDKRWRRRYLALGQSSVRVRMREGSGQQRSDEDAQEEERVAAVQTQ